MPMQKVVCSPQSSIILDRNEQAGGQAAGQNLAALSASSLGAAVLRVGHVAQLSLRVKAVPLPPSWPEESPSLAGDGSSCPHAGVRGRECVLPSGGASQVPVHVMGSCVVEVQLRQIPPEAPEPTSSLWQPPGLQNSENLQPGAT